MLLHGSADEQSLCSELSLSPQIAQRALHFWCEAGLLCEGEPVQAQKKLTTTDLARLSLEDKAVPMLLCECQRCAGREISHAESLELIELYRIDGAAPELILCALAYSIPLAPNSRLVRYARSVARSWLKAGIDSLEKAEAHIRLLQRRSARYAEVAAALGVDEALFKAIDKRVVDRWYEEYGYNAEFVSEAAVRGGNSDIQYINGILKTWRAKGYNTIKQTRQDTSNVPVSSHNKSHKSSMLDDALRKYEG